MVDRTSSTVFNRSCDPTKITGKTNASNDDSFVVPYGTLVSCMVCDEDNDDAIATASVSGSTVTLGLVDDEGAAIVADEDINFIAEVKYQ